MILRRLNNRFVVGTKPFAFDIPIRFSNFRESTYLIIRLEAFSLLSN